MRDRRARPPPHAMAPRRQRFAFSVALIARAAALSASKNAIAAHTNFVSSAGTGTGAASGDAAKHIERQRAVFDEAAGEHAREAGIVLRVLELQVLRKRPKVQCERHAVAKVCVGETERRGEEDRRGAAGQT